MSRRGRAASGASRSRWPASEMSAFHSAQPRPRDQVAGVHAELGPEPVPARAGQERPGDDDVARGIADAGGPEVDAPPPAARRGPAGCRWRRRRGTTPGRGPRTCAHGVLPHALDRVARDLVPSASIASDGLLLVGGQRPAAVEVVLAGRRARRSRRRGRRARRNPASAVAKSGRSPMRRVRRDLAVEPAVHRPRVREPRVGLDPAPPGAGSAAAAAGRARGSQRCSLATCWAYQLAARAAGSSARSRAGTCGCPSRRTRPPRSAGPTTAGTGCRRAGAPAGVDDGRVGVRHRGASARPGGRRPR